MKIKLTNNLVGWDGRDIIGSAEDTDPVTLRKALEMACIGADPAKWKTGNQKYEIYTMLKRLIAEELECDAKDIVLLKELVGAAFGPGVVGAVYDILEPPDA